MEQNAFARCQRFLNYDAVAKWLSIASSVGTALLYVGLLILLSFFIDLMVNNGKIPNYHQLSEPERLRFLGEMSSLEDKQERAREVKEELKSLGFDPAQVKNWEHGEPTEKWTVREPALLWWARLPELLRTTVNADAAEKVRESLKASIQRQGVEATLYEPLGDLGVLDLVVRNRNSTTDIWILGHLASWNEWTWVHGNTACLLGLFVLALVFAVLRLGLKFLANYMAARSVLEAVTRLRRAIYLHTNRLGILAFRALGPGEAVTISTKHLESVQEGLYGWLTVTFREPVKFGLLLLFAFLINFWLCVVFLLFAMLVWFVGGQVAAFFRQQGRTAETRSADQLALIEESLMLVRQVKAYLMESFNLTRVERQLSSYAEAQLLRYRGEAIYRPVFFFLGLTAVLILLLVAGYVMLLGRLGVTNTLVLIALMISLYWPTLAFLDARRSIRSSKESAEIVFEFLDRQEKVGQAIEASFVPPMAKLLQLEKVTLKEPGSDRKLLLNVSFSVRAGQRIAIVGPDEMEKHALIFLLPRFLDPSSGEIRIDGKNLRWVTLDSLRAQIGMVLQHNLVFNDTVAHNIGCGDPTYNLQRIIEAAKLAHAHQFIQKLPQGYETNIGDMGHTLKLGEKFRIALARAFLRDPAIMVIEEPSQALDEDTKVMIDDTFQRALAGRTVIFLPHRISTIRNCDQVYLLYLGQIEASGEHRELLANNDLYRHLQYLEFNEFATLLNSTAEPSNQNGK